MSNITAWHARGAIRPHLLCLHGTALLIETPLEKGAAGPERKTLKWGSPRWVDNPWKPTHTTGNVYLAQYILVSLYNKVKLLSHVLILCDPMDYNLPGFPVQSIFQARVLEWVAISFSRGSSWPRDRTQVSRIAGRCFTLWATREAPTKLFFIQRKS